MQADQSKIFGHFELLERIGSGGMADVFKARIASRGAGSPLIALKRMRSALSKNDEWVEMFTREARITAELHHPNIVEVLDFGHLDGVYYLAMEYIDGHDLGWLIERSVQRGQAVPLPIAAYVALALGKALSHAHRLRDAHGKLLGLVHRDVSPQNALISITGAVKLVDFGIAKAILSSTDTTHGKLKGKYSYMAPEQLQNDPLDRRTDIFALGAVLYETLTGAALFARTSIPETVRAITTEPITPPSRLRPEVSSRLDEIVLKALARAPRDRFDNGREFYAELKDCAESSFGVALGVDVAAWVESLRSTPAVTVEPAPPLRIPKPSAPRPPRRLTDPASAAPSLPPMPTPEPGLGTQPFSDDREDTGVTAEKLPSARPTFDDVVTSPRGPSGADAEWSIDESDEFFEPSGNKTLDANPDALLERLSSAENRVLPNDFSDADEHEALTAVALIDVEELLAKRRAEVQAGRSAEIPAPALPADEAIYAFGGDEEPTQAAPSRTASVLEALENYPSAEVVVARPSREITTPGAKKATSAPLAAVASDPTYDGVVPPRGTEPTAPNDEGVSFDEDAETVLNFNPPPGMHTAPVSAPAADLADAEATMASFASAPSPLAAPRAEARRPPASSTDAISFDLRLPLEPLADAPRRSRGWLWATILTLTLASAGVIAYLLLAL